MIKYKLAEVGSVSKAGFPSPRNANREFPNLGHELVLSAWTTLAAQTRRRLRCKNQSLRLIGFLLRVRSESYSSYVEHALIEFPLYSPPFTIQRLCELVLEPFNYYSTLPKFLRAVTRVLSVTSDRGAFTEGDDDFEFNYAKNPSTILSHDEELAQGAVMSLERGGEVPTRRPTTTAAARASSESSPLVIPLLSPIPWLIKTDSDHEGDVELLHLNPLEGGLSPTTAIQSPPKARGVASSSSLPPLSTTMTPTGGLVDEVDPGSGTSEIVDPIALTGSASVGAGGLIPTGASREDGLLEVSQRFDRASSPRPEGSEAVE